MSCTLAVDLKVVCEGDLIILEAVHLDFTPYFFINSLEQLLKEKLHSYHVNCCQTEKETF
jgi:hypothetical protein